MITDHLVVNDPRLLSSLVRLYATPEGRELVAWLEGARTQLAESLVRQQLPLMLSQTQGAAIAVECLIEVIKRSRSMLEQVS